MPYFSVRTPQAAIWRRFALEMAGLFGLSILAIGISKLGHSFAFRWNTVFLVLCPVYFLYFLLRSVAGRAASAAAALLCLAGLYAIHATKRALTGMCLSWHDINTTSMALALHYVSWKSIAAVAMLLGMLMLGIRGLSRRVPWDRRAKLRFTLPAAAITGAVALHPFLPDTPIALRSGMQAFLMKAGVVYRPLAATINVHRNGLFLHLVQTNQRVLPPLPSVAAAELPLPAAPRGQPIPRHVFYILCESCWYDTGHFASAFEPLVQRGFVPLRGVSPSYGGGTVNAAFEMLTGLPAHGALAGVVYQEYGELFDKQARTIARALREKGYRTYAMHNYVQDFWKRSMIMPKFGFDRFIGLENMRYQSSKDTTYPTDDILFKTALDALSAHPEAKAFFNLETVYMHGPYSESGPHDTGDYLPRLRETITEIATFVDTVQRISQDYLIVVYGDHKPALTPYFYSEGILPPEAFSRTGAVNTEFTFRPEPPQEIVGDTPVLVLSSRGDSAMLRQAGNGQPLYCIAAYLDRQWLGLQLDTSAYMLQHVCKDYHAGDYWTAARTPPANLYTQTLFAYRLRR